MTTATETTTQGSAGCATSQPVPSNALQDGAQAVAAAQEALSRVRTDLASLPAKRAAALRAGNEGALLLADARREILAQQERAAQEAVAAARVTVARAEVDHEWARTPELSAQLEAAFVQEAQAQQAWEAAIMRRGNVQGAMKAHQLRMEDLSRVHREAQMAHRRAQQAQRGEQQ